jgi:hypothetical protein
MLDEIKLRAHAGPLEDDDRRTTPIASRLLAWRSRLLGYSTGGSSASSRSISPTSSLVPRPTSIPFHRIRPVRLTGPPSPPLPQFIL